MQYTKNNQKFTIQDIRQLFPNKSIPNDADCSDLGFEFLEETPVPLQDGFYAVEVAPVNNKQTWELKAIPVVVPQSIQPLQAMLQLLEINLLDEVEEMVRQDRRVQLYWDKAQNFYRNDEILLGMAAALGLNDEQLDNLFIEASKR